MILPLFKKDPSKDAAHALYGAAVAAARRPPLYLEFGVEDSVEGRFELLCLHVWLVMRRLKAISDPAAARMSRRMLEAMVDNLDDSLREMGVGDLSVGKKIRALAENFYGRLNAYEATIGASEEFTKALARNVYEAADGAMAERLAAYARTAAASIDAQPGAALLSGRIEFPPVGGGTNG